MISLDGSVVPALIIFITLVITLNYILFRPLLRVQAERESRTAGTVARADKDLRHFQELFDHYQAAIRNARAEGYKIQERARAEALKARAEKLEQARKQAEEQIVEARASIGEQVQAARMQLAQEAEGMARSISAAILRKSA